MPEDSFVTRKEFNQLNKRIGNLEVSQIRTETRTDHLERKLDSIESNTTWILRIIIGAIITGIIGLILQGGI